MLTFDDCSFNPKDDFRVSVGKCCLNHLKSHGSQPSQLQIPVNPDSCWVNTPVWRWLPSPSPCPHLSEIWYPWVPQNPLITQDFPKGFPNSHKLGLWPVAIPSHSPGWLNHPPQIWSWNFHEVMGASINTKTPKSSIYIHLYVYLESRGTFFFAFTFGSLYFRVFPQKKVISKKKVQQDSKHVTQYWLNIWMVIPCWCGWSLGVNPG